VSARDHHSCADNEQTGEVREIGTSSVGERLTSTTPSELRASCSSFFGPRLGHERLTQDQKGREISRNDERTRIARFASQHRGFSAVAEVECLLRG
jgi:hypothetical protein